MDRWEQIYENSEESKALGRFEFGMKELEKLIKLVKRGLIKKSEYNKARKEIETQLLRI